MTKEKMTHREVLGNHLQMEPFHKFPHVGLDGGGEAIGQKSPIGV